MLISVNNISKAFGAEDILEKISFGIEENEKAAIVGANGAGKTTLFRLITGDLSADSGEITIAKDKTIGLFSQDLKLDSNKTIYNELLSVFERVLSIEAQLRDYEEKMAGITDDEELSGLMKKYTLLNHEYEKLNAYEYQSRLRGVIKGLGFSDAEADQPIYELSGGQKTKVALGKLLLLNPDLLLLDEPTNHLDIESVAWLEDFLKAYNGAIIIISHDRYFINKTTSKIIEIENRKSNVYNGNYDYYAQKKALDREIALKHYLNQQKEIKHQEEVIKKLKQFNREKSIKRAESREKALEKMELIDAPENLPQNMRIEIVPSTESGYDVLSVNDVSKSFDNTRLFRNVSFEIKKGDKVALIGANGIGKTTLFRLILGKLEADSGKIKKGANVAVGYFDQEQQNLDMHKTIFDEISDAYPKLTITKIRNTLASFVFMGDEVFKHIGSLSGGEKGRVSLAKVMLSNANFLLMDEPTNHLDLNSKLILEKALSTYQGTCLFISHDRYFINSIANKIIELTPDGVRLYMGNYDFYLEKRLEAPKETIQSTQSANKNDWQAQKQAIAEKRKLENRLKKLEEEIARLEETIAEADHQLTLPEVYSDSAKTNEQFKIKTESEQALDKLYLEWEELQE